MNDVERSQNQPFSNGPINGITNNAGEVTGMTTSTTTSTGTSVNSSKLDAAPSQYFNDSIFWIELEKIVPNPYQPRREFDPHALRDLAESIRMYGILQPLVVTRREMTKPDGGLAVQYELISGERRLRASKLAGLSQAPVIIRAGNEDARIKLELAIIENLQREDLNAVDRARSFQRLTEEFGLKHVQIAEKMGKSREYVTNTLRLLALPEHMLNALSEKKISEGHTRPLLMLVERSDEQEVLFKEIMHKRITVREAEAIARRVAFERARKKDATLDPEIRELESKLNSALGTRVTIEKKEKGGRVLIEFFDNNDIKHIIEMLEKKSGGSAHMNASQLTASGLVAGAEGVVGVINNPGDTAEVISTDGLGAIDVGGGVNTEGKIGEGVFIAESSVLNGADATGRQTEDNTHPLDDSTPADAKESDDLYSIKNFSI